MSATTPPDSPPQTKQPHYPQGHTPETAIPLDKNSLTDLLHYTPHASGLGLSSLVSLPPSTPFCPITSYTKTTSPTPHTLQISPDTHIHLVSALNYLNHSCNPSLEIDTEKMEVRVARGRRLERGDELTFFYPSTEWSMDGRFECLCGEERCVGVLEGAEGLSRRKIEEGGWWINGYILDLIEERDGGGK